MTRRSVVWLFATVVCCTPLGALAQQQQSSTDAETDAMAPAQAAKVLEDTRPRAESGDAAAQYNMGVLYDRGIGVAQNYATARGWYEKAAAQHYGRAEHNLGIMYEAGKGVDKNLVKAAQWFRRGAGDGQAASENNLGVLYMKGHGVPQNTGKAAFWTARAAAAGNGAAIDNLPRIVEDLPQRHVNADDVNVRDQPDRNARIVRQADSDSVVVVLAREADWTQVLFPKTYEIGWVANFLLADSLAPLAGGGDDDSRMATSPERGAPTESAPRPKQAAAPSPRDDDPVRRSATESGSGAKVAAAAADSAAAADKTSPGTKPEPADNEKPGAATVSKQPTATAGGSDEGAAAKSVKRRVGAGTVNLRSRPSRAGKVVGQVHRNDVVTVEETKNGWARVQTADNRKGWLAAYLLVGE
ncbi:SH3 domain-containing protein [Salinisphaera sp. Q1T1-3]|uniref:SH3 domain-containing protein n=1 Tax=Salinisphaera sp. Q1T1-3 TaxID=2321229 RepID=UPI000E71C1C4|nr:SH3 domain-containing protein [Salinisphaera sp. Q1T1-3]RJS91412.1 hypothetical protein D3260_15515 [Salinisphaera sp. Q1T1-3]